MRSYLYNNVKIFMGKNAQENSDLVSQYNSIDATWFHLHDLPSSHVIIEKTLKELNDEEIKFCANLVKFYTKYKKEWQNKYFVDMVSTKNVKLTSKPGLVTISKGKKVKIKPIFSFNPDEYKVD